MEKAIVPMVNFDGVQILNTINYLTKASSNKSQIDDYEQKDVSERILKIVSSYINYVNRKNYFKF